MKKSGKSANMYVMFGLLAVLFISLGYLSMQGGREGMEGAKPAGTPPPPTDDTEPAMPPSKMDEKKKPFEGYATMKKK